MTDHIWGEAIAEGRANLVKENVQLLEQRDRAINLGQELYEALLTADEVLSMVQAAAVKGVPHGMDLNAARAIFAKALRRKEAPI